MRWQGRRESENVEDRRGTGGGFGGFGGGSLGGGGLRFPVGGGRGGLGSIGLVLVLLFLGWLLGINPLELLNGGSSTGSFPLGEEQGQTGAAGAPSDEEGRFVATVLADTEDAWQKIFAAAGRTYRASRRHFEIPCVDVVLVANEGAPWVVQERTVDDRSVVQ